MPIEFEPTTTLHGFTDAQDLNFLISDYELYQLHLVFDLPIIILV